jgi:hypothetical protein
MRRPSSPARGSPARRSRQRVAGCSVVVLIAGI